MKTWKKMKRNLKKGDVIRTKVKNKNHPKYGQYVYSICSGDGFGCSMNTMGNAIFVDHQSFDLNEVLANRNKKPKDSTSYRWERFWGIEILDLSSAHETLGKTGKLKLSHPEFPNRKEAE